MCQVRHAGAARGGTRGAGEAEGGGEGGAGGGVARKGGGGGGGSGGVRQADGQRHRRAAPRRGEPGRAGRVGPGKRRRRWSFAARGGGGGRGLVVRVLLLHQLRRAADLPQLCCRARARVSAAAAFAVPSAAAAATAGARVLGWARFRYSRGGAGLRGLGGRRGSGLPRAAAGLRTPRSRLT
jgi:hypothetical protein